MDKIKFRLIKAHKMLCFDVLEQDKNWNVSKVFNSSTGIRVRTDNDYPYIANVRESTGSEIYLRGYFRAAGHREDNLFRFTTINFTDNNERDKYYERIIQSIKEWSEYKLN